MGAASQPSGHSRRLSDEGERLRVKIVATGDSEAGAQALAGEVRVETAGTVKAVGPGRSRGHGWYASFRLDVPRAARLRLEADNGACISTTWRARSSCTR